MPKYFKNENLTKESFERYCELRKLLANYELDGVLTNHFIDGRDVQPIFLAMHNGNPTGTDEEIGKKYQEFSKSFMENPKIALDALYDYFESFNLTDLNTKEDMLNAMTYLGINQAFSTAILKNPEYRDARYGKELDTMRKFDEIQKKSAVINKLLDDELQQDYKLNISSLGASKDNSMYYESDKEREWEENVVREEQSIVYSYANALTDNKAGVELTITENWFIATSDDPEKYENASLNVLVNQVFNSTRNPDSFSMLATNALGEDANYNRIHLQGKPLSKCIEDFEHKTSDEKKEAARQIIENAVKTGKALDLVDYHVCNGQAFAKVIPFKYNYTEEFKRANNEAHLKTYPWWRRTFFNWGPFKIKNPLDYDKVNANNEKDFSKRCQAIQANFKANIKNNLEDNYPDVVAAERLNANKSNPTRNNYLEIPKICTKEDIEERRKIEVQEELNTTIELTPEEAKEFLTDLNNEAPIMDDKDDSVEISSK